MSENKLVIETELGTKSFESQYKQLEQKLKTQQKRLEKLLQIKASGMGFAKGDINSEIQQAQTSVENLSNKMIDLRLKVKNAGDETDDMGQKTDFNFKKMGNTIKKFGLSLIGLRSIYSLVSRASSAYLSQDTELAEKLRSVWVGLGSFLAPVLEMISNSLLKALGYLNVFIKALTGIDFLARANAKALKAQASAQKELNRQTYDFDVIRTQQDTSSSGGSAGAGSGGLFEIPELDQNLVNKLQDLAKWLRENWDLIKKVGEALLITFGAIKIAKVLKGIATLLGGGTAGLLGLQSVLTGLLTIGVITLGVYLLYTAMTGRDLIEDLKNIKTGVDELKKSTEANTRADNTQTQSVKRLISTMKEAHSQGKLNNELIKQTTTFFKNSTTAIAEQIKTIESNTIKTEAMREEEKALKEQLDEIIQGYDFLYQNQQLSEEEMYDYIYAIDQQIQIMKNLGEDTSSLEQKYKDLTGREWQLKLNSNTNQAESTVTKFVRWLNDLVAKPFTFWIETKEKQSQGSSGSYYSSGGGRHFALGGIVTQPTRALIGEAGYPEAVVPMTQDYLSTLANEIARFGGNGGSGTVNVYLDGRLIQRQVANTETRRNFNLNR